MIRLLIGFLIVFLHALSSRAQDEYSKWIVGLSFEAVENRYSVFGDTNYGSNALTKSHTAYNFGIDVKYSLNSWIYLRSGIGLSDLGYDLEYFGIGYPMGIYAHKVTYLDIPLEVELFFPKAQKRFNIFLSGGGIVSFLNRKEKPSFANGTTAINLSNFDNFDEYAPIVYSVFIGIGFSYNYSARISMEILPLFRSSINKNTHGYISGDTEWTKIQSSGVKFSLNYKI